MISYQKKYKMCNIRKNGEEEAITILKAIGKIIDEKYKDDNSRPNMPDLKYAEEPDHYIEVTHTNHDNSIYFEPRRFYRRKDGENSEEYNRRLKDVEYRCAEALTRLNSFKYEYGDDGKLTMESQSIYKKDLKLVKDHLGYDPTKNSFKDRYTEKSCDRPTIIHSVENILHEIEKDKGPKHSSGNTDLFIYVTEEEYRIMLELLASYRFNGTSQDFLNRMCHSGFPVVYICEWNLRERRYNTIAPHITKLNMTDNSVKWVSYNTEGTE